VRPIAPLAAVVLGLSACGGGERVLEVDRALTGRVEEAAPARTRGWPNAETSFCNARVGFGRSQPAAGRSSIFATTSGGRTWSRRARLDIGAGTLTCVSRTEVVLSGYPPLNATDSGTILLRSRDGGRHWRRLHVPIDASSPASVLASRTFVATRRASSWYVTRDGARTWQTVAPSRSEPFEAVAFLSRDVAYAVTSRGDPQSAATSLWRSDDGARTWTRVPNRITGLRIHGLSSASGTLWVHGVRCPFDSCSVVLLRTGDDGRSWDAIELPALPPELRFTSSQTGVARGTGGVYVTRDGGVTWTWRAPRP